MYGALSWVPRLLSSAPGVSTGASPNAAQYHAPVIDARVVCLGVVLSLTGCLENLNQLKYFERLEAQAPALAPRVQRHRLRIEQQLGALLRAQAPAETVQIGYWGETWDRVRRVSDGERLFMKGRIFHPEGPASTYYLSFTVAEDGTVQAQEVRVFGRPHR